MGTQTNTVTAPPPHLIGSLRTGFDTVANHVSLILLPILLDLFLWLGPRFTLKTLFEAVAREMQALAEVNSPQVADLWKATQQSWLVLADHFNLANALRTYPVGIPSLMTGELPTAGPLGQPIAIPIQTLGTAILWWMLFSVIGLILASQYFNSVAIVTGGLNPRDQVSPMWAAAQVVLLTVACAAVLIVIVVPAMLVLSMLAFISAGMAQFATILLSVLLIWVIVPLLFSPHGIFLYRQNALRSMLTSMRLMRFILPGTGLFFLSILVLSQGLDLLWQVPPSESWLSLVAIAGHAFVTTALLASTFVYYQDAMTWVQEFLQRRVAPQGKA